ncbi:hypothetical protein ACFVT5_02860 [Streptomyces sp. NPDC058001]|uniref:hypothetical protein n=1 Tax=Streptomyces sp. NPDC058001 TaxID=3346300 RepID=UPI0036E5468B
MSFAVGAVVQDHTRAARGIVWKRSGDVLHLQDSVGCTWTVLEKRCTLVEAAPEYRPERPRHTLPARCAPHEVRVGDYVLLDHHFCRVNDMRGKGGASGRILILERYGPWVMTSVREIFRPIISVPGPKS